jgi:hypothetical protein
MVPVYTAVFPLEEAAAVRTYAVPGSTGVLATSTISGFNWKVSGNPPEPVRDKVTSL